MDVAEFMSACEPYGVLVDAVAKCWDVLGRHRRPVVFVSGGSDSDIVVDMVHKLDEERKCIYVYNDTGLEYQATREHLRYLERHYGITIERTVPTRSIGSVIEDFGVPFLSKYVSAQIRALQVGGFRFEERTLEEDSEEYGIGKSYLKWWNNYGTSGRYKVDNVPRLREFLSEHTPEFKISDRCCWYLKKYPAVLTMRKTMGDVKILGIRRSEGGTRSFGSSCYTQHSQADYAVYRPIFWFCEEDKRAYEARFGIRHSDCYEVYGLRRTGCVGCPYNRKVISELSTVQMYEGSIVKASMRLFGHSYEYTRKFREYQCRKPPR